MITGTNDQVKSDALVFFGATGDLAYKKIFPALQSAIRKELFRFEDMESFTRNPMAYARALDVLIYIKRDFAPLPDRVRSIISILNQAPKIYAAARENATSSRPASLRRTSQSVKSSDGWYFPSATSDSAMSSPFAWA